MDTSPSPFRIGKQGDRGLLVSRGFASPGQRILRAHIDPDIAPLWLGSADMRLLECHIDPRPGGRFSYRWMTDDMGEIGVSGQFIDLAETRIRHEETYTPAWSHGPVQVTTEIAPEITALGHGTLLTLSLRYHDRTTRDLVLSSPMADGIESSYQRLEALLES